jgi:hypothetical protein
MKTLLALFLLTAATAFADAPFPGLKVIMTPEEYARAGLDALSPDQIEVIDAAIVRHYMSTVTAVANKQAEQITQKAVTDAVAQEKHANWLSNVGLAVTGGDWKNQPSIKARCTGWVTGNSFKLDNGQVWEGVETIRIELSGKDIEIQPRPMGNFDLVVDGYNTHMLVVRIR